MKHFFTLMIAILIVMSGFSQAENYRVQTIWERAAGDLYPYNTGNNSRNMALGVVDSLGEKHTRLFIPSRFQEPNVYVVNPIDGNTIHKLPITDDVEGGLFIVNTVGVTTDGVILVSNMVNATGNMFKVYSWKTQTSNPEVAVKYTIPADARLGDKMDVIGNYADGSAQIWVGNFMTSGGNALVYVFKMIPDTENSGKYVFSSVPDIKIAGPFGGSFMNVAHLGDGSYYWDASGTATKYVDASGVLSTEVASTQVEAAGANSIHYITNIDGFDYIANYRNDGKYGEVFKFRRGNLNASSSIAHSKSFAGGTENGMGGITVDISYKTPRMYVLSPNNGVGAYALIDIMVPDHTDNITKIWERPGNNGLLKPDFIGSGYGTRDIAVGELKDDSEISLYGINASNPLQITEMKTDGTVGVALALPSTAALQEGSQPIWSADVTQDGYLLVANTSEAGKKFKVYAYAGKRAASTEVLSYTVPAGVNLGFYGKVSVIGKLNDGTAKLYVTDNTFYGTTAAPQAKVYIFSMTQQGGNYTFNTTPQIVTFDAGARTEGTGDSYQNLSVSVKADGSFIWDDTYRIMRHVGLDGVVKSVAKADAVYARANVAKYIGKDSQNNEYIAFFNYNKGRAEVYKYPAGNLGGDGAAVIATTSSFADIYGASPSAEAQGGISIRFTAEKHPVIYVMSQNRGVGAYELNIPMDGSNSSIEKNTITSNLRVYQQGNKLVLPEGTQHIELIAITGQKIASVTNQSEISVDGLHGIYVVRATDMNGHVAVQKVVIR